MLFRGLGVEALPQPYSYHHHPPPLTHMSLSTTAVSSS